MTSRRLVTPMMRSREDLEDGWRAGSQRCNPQELLRRLRILGDRSGRVSHRCVGSSKSKALMLSCIVGVFRFRWFLWGFEIDDLTSTFPSPRRQRFRQVTSKCDARMTAVEPSGFDPSCGSFVMEPIGLCVRRRQDCDSAIKEPRCGLEIFSDECGRGGFEPWSRSAPLAVTLEVGGRVDRRWSPLGVASC